MSVKVLTVGSVNGDMRTLAEKATALHNKHGPFDMLLCTGNFFAKENDEQVLRDLLTGKIDFPIATYFIHGAFGLPSVIKSRALQSSGEICPNLFYLGSGLTTTSEGVRIGAVSGVYDPAIFEANVDSADYTDALKTRYHKSDFDALVTSLKSMTQRSQKGIDILLTHEWPEGITSRCDIPVEDLPVLRGSEQARQIGFLTKMLQPRYHFAGSANKFWERSPYRNVDGAIHSTRFLGLGNVANKEKVRWFYAFNLVPITKATTDVLLSSITPKTTDSPFQNLGVAGQKRTQDEAGPSMFWGDNLQKKSAYVCRICNIPGHKIQDCPQAGQQRSQSLPEGYICKICNNPGHRIDDCPEKTSAASSGPPPDYICKLCTVPGHWIKDCPEKTSTASSGPPPDYICKLCTVPGHWIKDCPQRSAYGKDAIVRDSREERWGPREPVACWFCLSNPALEKTLITSIGTEVYMTVAKGQLPPEDKFLVPGGGHVLLIAINHVETLQCVAGDEKSDLEAELKNYKDGLRRYFASKNATMVTWEVGASGPMHHAHVQVLAVPPNLDDAIESAFKSEVESLLLKPRPQFDRPQHGRRPGSRPTATREEVEESVDLVWQDSVPEDESQFFKVELPSGKTMVCPVPSNRRMDVQFGRRVLASVLGMPERSNWKECTLPVEEESKITKTFKEHFKAFDFTLK